MRTSRRAGISEIVAAVLTIAITLIAGAALYSYVNAEASNSENGLGSANAANVNYLNERFVVADMGFNGNSATIWLYNNGNLALNLQEVVLYSSADAPTPLYSVFNSTSAETTTTATPGSSCGTISDPAYGSAGGFVFGLGGTSIPVGSTYEISLQAPTGTANSNCLVSGTNYYIMILGAYGNQVIYDACDSTSGECTS